MIRCSNKTCRKEVEKPGYCAECRREKGRAWREDHPGYATEKSREWVNNNRELARERWRERYYRNKSAQPPREPKEKKTPLTMAERKKRYFEKHPIKAEARKIYKYALRTGKIQKQPCAVCGALEVDGHHTDYTKPLEVVWLCKPHHREAHKNTPGLD